MQKERAKQNEYASLSLWPTRGFWRNATNYSSAAFIHYGKPWGGSSCQNTRQTVSSQCQDFPLNCHCLPKSHIHGHVIGHALPSTKKQPTTTNQRLARMASHNQNFTVIPHNAYVMKSPVCSLCFRLLKHRVVLLIFCFSVFIILLLFHGEGKATKIIFLIGKKKSGLSGNVIVLQSSQNVHHILQHVCF